MGTGGCNGVAGQALPGAGITMERGDEAPSKPDCSDRLQLCPDWPLGPSSSGQAPRSTPPPPWLGFRIAGELPGRKRLRTLPSRGQAVTRQLVADSQDMGLVKSRAEPPYRAEPPRREDIQCLVDLNPLPDELLVLILSWVSGRTLVTRCRLVCQRWRDLIDRPTLWILKLKRDPAKRSILEATLKVTGLFPEIEWCRLGVLQPFGRNLIKDPCGREHLLHWEVQEDGDGWAVEESKDFVEGAETQTCFVSSYQCCSKWQVVDLLKEGLWKELLDTYQPDILISDWWGAREDCGCSYEISVSLLAANKRSIIAEFNLKPDPIPQWNDAKYQQVSYVFQNYGPGVRYVRFSHQGQDTQFWAGHYGARVTNSMVRVKI